MDSIYFEYENTLIGRQKDIGIYNFYGQEPGGVNEKIALNCIRFCIEKLLGWNIEQAVLQFDSYIIKEMKLEKVITYIKYPIEVPDGNPRYILSLLYPKKVHLNKQELIENIYNEVLNETCNEQGEKRQFPRDYFTGTEGFHRFCVCLKFLIENYKPFDSIEKLYQFFLSAEGKRFLYDYRLKVPADQFDINILECIWTITASEPDRDLFYCYYCFMEKWKTAK